MKPTKRRIADIDELMEYRSSKRKGFEDEIRRQRHHLGTWIKYANWEESQQEFKRARSIFERAIDVDYKSQSLWLKYAEMEMKHKCINHARNVWDRAVTLLPRVSQFWYKYAFMEEMVGNIAAARNVFERWMKWMPEDSAWFSYIKLETRAKQFENARSIYERYIDCHPYERAYIKYAKWEQKNMNIVLARNVFERAVDELEEKSESIYIAFSNFEQQNKEYERARAILQFALDQVPKEQAVKLHNAFVRFEKQYGDKKSVDHVVIAKRRVEYEKQLAENAMNYDVWFDYIKLEEAEAESERERIDAIPDDELVENVDELYKNAGKKVCDVYERAIANVPPIEDKQYWARYIYLWINYAFYQELGEDDTEKTRMVYQKCLQLVPHKVFTFSKIWIYLAEFEIRQRNMTAARKVLGQALGRHPTHKLYKQYIQLELQLGQVKRCRKLYEKYLLFEASNCKAWIKYAELESGVGELERTRGIFELAINQPVLDMPELLWKAFIDFEIDIGEYDRATTLYERLLERTKHVKVWISFAKFKKLHGEEEDTRDIYDRAYSYFKEAELNDERYMVGLLFILCFSLNINFYSCSSRGIHLRSS